MASIVGHWNKNEGNKASKILFIVYEWDGHQGIFKCVTFRVL